jgi:phosphopantetheinyl transferase
MMRFLIRGSLPYEALLAAAEQQCPQILAERMLSHPAQMAERLNAYLLLAELFGGNLPPLCFAETGKPFLVDRSAWISLSHTKTGVAAAVSDKPIGIDLQTVVSYKERLARRACSESELQLLASLTDSARDECFTRIWTAKEAMAKAQGDGMARLGLRNLQTDPTGMRGRLGEQVYLLSYPQTDLEQTVCCIAQELLER